MSIFEKRCEKAQALMAETGIDFLFIGGGTDMKYMTDYTYGESERLALFVLPVEGKGSFIGPRFARASYEAVGEVLLYHPLYFLEVRNRGFED